MGKHKKNSEKEGEHERDRIWKKLKELEKYLQKNSVASPSGRHLQPSFDLNQTDFGNTSASDEKSVQLTSGIDDLPTAQSVQTIPQTSMSGNSSQAVGGILNNSVAIDLATMATDQSLIPESDTVDIAIDDETKRILGDDPRTDCSNVGFLHPELTARWSNWITEGIKKEVKEDLLRTYPRAENCFLEAQVLNPEVAATMQESAIKRDNFSALTQKLNGSAMIALGLAISLLLKENGEEGIDKNELLEYLCDAGKLLTEVHHHVAMTRRSFILPSMEKNIKDVLIKSKLDKFLFGENLAEKIKSTKSIEKVALQLRPKVASKRMPLKSYNNLNWNIPSSKNQGPLKMGNKQPSILQLSRNSTSRRPRGNTRYSSFQSHSRTSRYKTDHRQKD